jgi:hypothetical protein
MTLRHYYRPISVSRGKKSPDRMHEHASCIWFTLTRCIISLSIGPAPGGKVLMRRSSAVYQSSYRDLYRLILSRTLRRHYYVRVAPGNSFVGKSQQRPPPPPPPRRREREQDVSRPNVMRVHARTHLSLHVPSLPPPHRRRVAHASRIPRLTYAPIRPSQAAVSGSPRPPPSALCATPSTAIPSA